MQNENPPRVLNAKQVGKFPPNSVYVGRPSKWGNLFEIGRDGSRDEVIALHEQMIMSDPAMIRDAQRELRGKDLVCWCSPSRCHADTLLRIANS
jgi:hypothetical protein